MRLRETLVRSLLPGLLAIPALGLVTAPAPAGAPATLFPGAKRVHTFTREVYRVPVLVTTARGPRLEIWFDAFDPEPPPRPGQIPGLTRLPDPRIELLVWDPLANKQLHKLSYPESPLAYPHVSALLERDGGMALSPDGKLLASKTITYTPRLGSPYGDFTTQVKLIDVESRKVQLVRLYKDEKAPGALQTCLLFAPDGALVTLRGTTCTVQEPGKQKPRVSFPLGRAAGHRLKWFWFTIQDAVVSPDGTQLAVAADGRITVYDTATGKKLFEAPRAAPEPRKAGDPYPGNASLAYAASPGEPTLLAAEAVVGSPKGQKDFLVARRFDLKNRKETANWRIRIAPRNPDANFFGAPHSGVVSAYFTAGGEPRVHHDGKVFDGDGKVLHRFDPGACTFVSRDGKVLVRMTRKAKEGRTMVAEVWGLDTDR